MRIYQKKLSKRLVVIIGIMILHSSLFTLLLHAQVAHVSYTSSRHYNQRVAEFERLAPIDSTQIVMLGNSLTENAGDWNERLQVDNVVNRGIIGDTAEGMSERLCQILPGKPRAIFLMCGINDLSHNLTPEQVFSRVQRLIDRIRKEAPETKLYVESLLPINESNGRWKTLAGKTDDIPRINEKLKQYCQLTDIPYIDLFSHFTRGNGNQLMPALSADGLHITKIGYKIWAAQLRPIVYELNGMMMPIYMLDEFE